MDSLYSLYDALISVNVPHDKARAVIDALGRDMDTTIATKMELQLLRQDLQHLRQEMATKVDLADTRAGVADVRQECTLIRKDMELLSTTLTLRLGSMLMFGLGLLFAALKIS
ncbi:MAG: hypothetical protein ABL989_15195 [Gammaproteobacteria bacterium]